MKQMLFCCHECGLLNRVGELNPGSKALCSRCGFLLRRNRPGGHERALALALTSLVLLAISLSFPFLRLENIGLSQQSNLLSGVLFLFQQKMPLLATVILTTCVGIPVFFQVGLVYVLLPLLFGKKLPRAATLFRWLRSLGTWGMVEIFLFGVLVALVKLVKMAHVSPGPAFWGLFLLTFVIAAQALAYEPLDIWEKLEVDDAR